MPSPSSNLPLGARKRCAGIAGALNGAIEAFSLHEEKTLDELLTKIIKPLAEAMGVDQIFIDRQIEMNGETLLCRVYRWDGTNGVFPLKDENPLPVDKVLPEWADTLRQGCSVCRSASEIASDENSQTDDPGLKSCIIIPIMTQGEYWGNVVFEDEENEMRFDDDCMSLIRSYALLCANAIMRNDLELEIIRQNEVNTVIVGNMRRLETESQKIYYDPLTGVYNRRFFDERLSRLISTLSRSGGVLSFLMFDIDNFKNYNDSFGHAAGDECLKTIANILTSSTARTDDFVVRYGGDEFAAVLPNTEESGARMIAEKILHSLNSHVMHVDKNDKESKVTASIGVTAGKVRPKHRPDDFILRADELLYKSKQDGRNRYTFGSL